MNPEPPNEFDSTVERHFSSHLDSQIGRSTRAFTVHLQTQPLRRPRGIIITAAVSTAAAAVIALALVHRNVAQHVPAHPSVSTNGTLEQVVWSRTTDAGTVVLDNGVPARRVVREQIRELTWTDSAGVKHIRSVTPQTDIMLISLDKY